MAIDRLHVRRYCRSCKPIQRRTNPMYLLFAPAIIAFVVIAFVYIKNDLDAFTAAQLRFAAKYVFALVVFVFAVSRILSAMGR